jgi:pyruvate/2-oxoglutarate dehydrogenase complex dihydrolipoamide dehydrogenase (E3) component
MRRRLPDPEADLVAVLVIGAGASGVATARAAAAAAAVQAPGRPPARVVLVGDTRPGGGARLVADGGTLLDRATRGLDWHATMAQLRTVRAVVEDRSREAALRADGVEFVPGHARLAGGGLVTIEPAGPVAAGRVPERLRAGRIVLATGDEPRLPEVSGLADTRYLTAETVLGLADLPPTLIVLGGGAQGCEFAQAFARFGVQVTLVEAAARLLPDEHPEASALVTQALRADGVRVVTGSPVTTVAPTLDGGAWLGIGPGGDVAADGLLLATGRQAAVRGLDLPAAGVRLTASGWLGVDEYLATTGPRVLAVGRATGLLPHGCTDPVMARVAGANAVARRPRSRWTPAGLPRVVRTEPTVATVGIGPAEAGGVPGARVGAMPLGGFDHALLGNSPNGLVSLVGALRAPRRPVALRGRGGQGGKASALLGASVIGPQAAELAGLVAVALRAGLTVEQLAEAPLSSRSWAAALQHAAAGFSAPA